MSPTSASQLFVKQQRQYYFPPIERVTDLLRSSNWFKTEARFQSAFCNVLRSILKRLTLNGCSNAFRILPNGCTRNLEDIRFPYGRMAAGKRATCRGAFPHVALLPRYRDRMWYFSRLLHNINNNKQAVCVCYYYYCTKMNPHSKES